MAAKDDDEQAPREKHVEESNVELAPEDAIKLGPVPEQHSEEDAWAVQGAGRELELS